MFRQKKVRKKTIVFAKHQGRRKGIFQRKLKRYLSILKAEHIVSLIRVSTFELVTNTFALSY